MKKLGFYRHRHGSFLVWILRDRRDNRGARVVRVERLCKKIESVSQPIRERSVRRSLARIILLENSLLVLEQGVLEGRRVFGNIVKYLKMAASSNFGSMFSVVGASAFLPFLPMLLRGRPYGSFSFR
jgi:hypothetical protein